MNEDLRVVVAVSTVDVVVLRKARGTAAGITGTPGSDVADLARGALLNGRALLHAGTVLNRGGKGLGEDGREGSGEDEELHVEGLEG